MSENGGFIPCDPQKVEEVVNLIHDLFATNKVEKYVSAVAMVVLLRRLKDEGYEIIVEEFSFSDEVH